MQFPNIIGITGKAGSGKSTVANLICEKLPGYQQYAFATPIKDACTQMFGWSREHLESQELKNSVDMYWGFSPRKAMQLLGTEFGRSLNPDVWLKSAAKKTEGTPTVFTDVRFENEANWVRSRGGVLIHIKAPSVDAICGTHASEAGVAYQEGDYILKNDHNGIEGLQANLDQILVLMMVNTVGI